MSRNRSAILLATAALLVPSPLWALDTLDLNNIATTRTTLDHTPGHPYDRVVNGPLTLTIIAPRILTYAGGLQDGAHPLSLGVNGAGTLRLTGSGLNTYSGDTRISSDSFLVAGAANVLSANSVITSGNIDLGGFDQTIRGLVGSGPVKNSSASLAHLTFLTPTGSTLTYSGSISGSVTVVKSGGGRQVLGATNSYTGGTTITAGALAYGTDTSLGTGAIALNGGTLAGSGAGLTLGNAISLGADSIYDRGGFSGLTLAGTISGNHALTLIGNGSVVLSGTNLYTGGTILDAGRVVVGANAAFGTGTVTATNSARLEANGDGYVVTNNFDLATLMQVTLPGAGNTLTLDGTLGGSGGLWVRSGDGVLRLGGNNVYTGLTQLATGTLAVTSSTALGVGTLSVVGPATLRADTAGLMLANKITLDAGQLLTIDTAGVDLTLTGPVRNRLAAIAGGFTKTGAGTLTLTNINTYSGGTRIADGAISVAADTALGRTASDLVFAGTGLHGGALIVTGTGFGSTARAIRLEGTGGAFDIADPANSFVVGQVITGSGELGKRGAGLLALDAANTYSGGTYLTAGTLRVGNSQALGSGALTIAGGTLLAGAAGLNLGNAVVLSAGATDTIDTGGVGLTLGGTISGAGVLTKTGAGTLALTGTGNSYSGGTVLTAGAIAVGVNGALGTGSAALANGTSIVATASATLTNGFVLTGTGTFDTGGNALTLANPVTGSGLLTKAGSGTLTLAAANAYGGGTQVGAGTLAVANNAALGSGTAAFGAGTTLQSAAAGLTLGNALTVAGSVIDTQGFDLTLNGAVAGTSFTKNGSGTLTLNAANTYTGTTTVAAGTLRLDGSTAAGPIAVASGATLSGSGTAGGTATFANGATLSPGGGIGTLTLGGLVLSDTTNVRFDLGTPNVVGGPTNDLVRVTGNVTLDGQLTVNGGVGFVPGVYALIRYGGALTDEGLAIASLPGAYAGQVQTTIAGQVNLIVATPGALVQYWDGGDATGNGMIDGGPGVWSSGGTNWTGAAPSLINSNWQSAIGVFVAPGGAVTINSPQTFQGLQFVGDGYVLSATGTGGLVTSSAAFISVDPGLTTTIAAPITGTGSLDKQGGGRLILSGASTYSGGTTVTAGTLGIGSNTAAGSGAVTLGAGTILQAEADGLNFGNAVFLPGSSAIDTQAFALLLGGVVSGPGSLTKTGSGNLTLGGTNTYAGGTTVAAGTLTGSATSFGTGGIVDNAALVLAQSADATLANAISGSGTVTKTGAGNLTLAGINTYAGGTTISGGTLTGSATSFGSGGIVDNAALVLAQPTDASFGNAISGTGTLTKTGAGNLTLVAVNTYSGGTTISGGMLTGSATSFGSGAIVDNAALLLAQPTDASFGNAISGTGTVTKTAAGNLTLAGVNTYAGGTTIVAGTLTGSATSFGTGGIVDNAALVLVQPTDATFANAISGTGTVTKAGAGNLTLAGINTYAGGTTIGGGTLTGSATSFGSGGIVDNAALVLAQPTDATLANVISGTGTVTKTGAGNLTLTGASTLSGATTVAAGQLTVTGSLSPSTVTVASGASLAGTGTIGGLVAQSGSLVTPGTAPGMTSTLTVAGNASFAPGSTFAVDVSPTTADLLKVGGSATLAGNLTIAPTGGQYLFNSVYTLVSAGSLTGTFTPPVLTNLFGPAFAPVLSYSGTALTLKLVPNSIIGLATGLNLTPNERNRAAAFDQAVIAGYNPQGFFALFNQGAALPAALDQLTGEVHSATSRVAMEDTRHVREAVLDRLGAALSGLGKRDNATTLTTGDRSYTLWGRGVASWARTDASSIASGFDHDLTGTIVGFDIGAGDFKAGALFHYTRSTLDYAILGHGKVASTGVGIYGGYRADHGFAVGVGGSIAAVDIDTSRAITTVGYAQSLSSKSDGESRQVFADVSYDLATGSGARLEPFVRFAYVGFRADAFGESGGIAALYAPTQNYHTTFATLGARGAIAVGPVALKGSAGWLRTGGDRSPASLLALRDTASFASIEGVPLDRNALAAEAGAEIAIGRASTFGVGYSGVIGKDTRDHGARATLTIGF